MFDSKDKVKVAKIEFIEKMYDKYISYVSGEIKYKKFKEDFLEELELSTKEAKLDYIRTLVNDNKFYETNEKMSTKYLNIKLPMLLIFVTACVTSVCNSIVEIIFKNSSIISLDVLLVVIIIITVLYGIGIDRNEYNKKHFKVLYYEDCIGIIKENIDESIKNITETEQAIDYIV